MRFSRANASPNAKVLLSSLALAKILRVIANCHNRIVGRFGLVLRRRDFLFRPIFGDEKPLPCKVHRKMIEPTPHVAERNPGFAYQRLLRAIGTEAGEDEKRHRCMTSPNFKVPALPLSGSRRCLMQY